MYTFKIFVILLFLTITIPSFSQPKNSSLIQGASVNLKYIPEVGETKFFKITERYMISYDYMNNQDYSSSDLIAWYYVKITPLIINKDSSIIYEIYFDSISVYSEEESSEEFKSETYNSNIRNDIFYNDGYLAYSILSNKTFSIIVSNKGELKDVFSLNEVLDYYRILVKEDGGSDQEVKEIITTDYINPLIGALFLKFSDSPVAFNKSWEKKYEELSKFYTIRTTYTYIPENFTEKNNEHIIEISGDAGIEFILQDEYMDGFKITENKISNTGLHYFNLSTGFLENSTSDLYMDVTFDMTGKSSGLKYKYIIESSHKIEEIK